MWEIAFSNTKKRFKDSDKAVDRTFAINDKFLNAIALAQPAIKQLTEL